jgi:uncharacterized membrane protein
MKLPNALRSTRVYWMVTALMCLFIAGGAVFDIAKTADVIKVITALGYPEYVIRFLGVLKLAGVAAIIASRFPRLKHWAYAGLVFDTGAALYSHLSARSTTTEWLPALLGLVIVGASYGLYTITLDPLSEHKYPAS